MTTEQFFAAYEILQEEKKVVESKIEALKQRYIESMPFKVGDCVRVLKKSRCYSTEKAWITNISLELPKWSRDKISFKLIVAEPKKDGTPSRRKRELLWVRPDEVELINAEG